MALRRQLIAHDMRDPRTVSRCLDATSHPSRCQTCVGDDLSGQQEIRTLARYFSVMEVPHPTGGGIVVSLKGSASHPPARANSVGVDLTTDYILANRISRFGPTKSTLPQQTATTADTRRFRQVQWQSRLVELWARTVKPSASRQCRRHATKPEAFSLPPIPHSARSIQPSFARQWSA